MNDVLNPSSAPPSSPGDPPWEIALLFPTQGEWTEDEYLALNTNRMVELSNGCLEVLPMPTFAHQLIVRFLFLALDAFVTKKELGNVLFAPLPVRLWEGEFREPDILFLRPGRKLIRGQPKGADLVMEIVSAGEENRKRDYQKKRRIYAKAGIKEYWIVDPEEEKITVLTLKGKTYRQHGVYRPGQTAESKLLKGFSVAAADVFAAAKK